MTLKFIDLYNDITGQAWSMFDGEVESQDEFELSVTTSIQKALSDLWCSYNFPFRSKEKVIKTKINKNNYSAPNGNIQKDEYNGKKVYRIMYNGHFLDYDKDYLNWDDKQGEPKKFAYKNDNLYIYPMPDDVYSIKVGYWTFMPCLNENGEIKSTLEDENDTINIPEKYGTLFKHALMTLAMTYLIANQSDENYSDYKLQYRRAYQRLLSFCKGLEVDKVIGW